MTDSTPTSPPTEEPPKRPLWRRPWFIVLAAVVLLFIIIGVTSGGDTTDTTTGTTTATATTEEATTDTEPAGTTDAAATTAAVTTAVATTTATTDPTTTTTTEPPATTQPPVEASPRPVRFEGSGTDVIQLEGRALTIAQEESPVLRFEMAGEGNNALWLLDSNVEQTDLLINTIGPIAGNRVLALAASSPEDIAGFEIESEGAWNLTLLPLVTVRPNGERQINVPFFDSGQQMTVTPPTGLVLQTTERVVDVTFSGDSNIGVWIASLADGSIDLLVNEIGPYEATVRLPNCSERCVLDIDGAGGEFTITIP
jgi:hypothetical protein